MAESANAISITTTASGWRVTIGPNEEAFDFQEEGEAIRLVQAFDVSTGVMLGSATHPSSPLTTEIQPDGEQRERLWTVRAYVDAWAIDESVIAAESAEEAKEIMRENRPDAWGDPEISQFDHTEFEVDDDEVNTVIEQN